MNTKMKLNYINDFVVAVLASVGLSLIKLCYTQ